MGGTGSDVAVFAFARGIGVGREITLHTDDIALILRLCCSLHLVRQLVHIQRLVGALKLAVATLTTEVALLLRLGNTGRLGIGFYLNAKKLDFK